MDKKTKRDCIKFDVASGFSILDKNLPNDCLKLAIMLVDQLTLSGVVNVNVIVVLNANVLRLDEDRRQRRSGISFWT